MAQTIRVLPEHLANKIAAGEVVQRPASAVKELLENSIDAGARSITIVIAHGGKSMIRIVDDGGGLGPEDARLAFERHATSKISSYEDIENIRTLGFRGEALASIAAVAQVEMRTRRAEDEVGTRIRIEGGVMADPLPEASPPGTSLTVRNLFYNTPARRNFLKNDAAEYKQVYDVVQRIALSHPSIAIAFMSGDETILDLPASTPAGRVESVFGAAAAKSIIPFEERSEPLGIRGFLGKPGFARKTRAEQYLFLNQRFILNRSVNHAVFKAYEHLLEKGSFPFFLLFLSIDPRRVDVNVHPSKMEVKFADESMIYRIVHSAVRKALSANDLIPTAELREGTPERGSGLVFRQEGEHAGLRVADWKELIRTPSTPREGPQAPVSLPGGAGSEAEAVRSAPSPTAPIWQVHNKYIMTPVENGVLVIDQHAAHERVIYERTIERFNESVPNAQQLLFPHTFELTPGDAALVRELLPLLERLGFNLKMFGKTTAVIDGVPADIRPGSEKTILREIVDLFKEDSQNVELEPREKLAKSFSCRAAVKSGDPLNVAEMHSLLDQLFVTRIPYSCPHGRPVMIRLSLTELDRKFGRTS